jgi:hypothetical protein
MIVGDNHREVVRKKRVAKCNGWMTKRKKIAFDVRKKMKHSEGIEPPIYR